MSVQLLSAVWNYEVTGNTRAVIQVLCDYANDEGICWPSNDAVAFKVGVSKRQVQRILGELTEKGAIEALEIGGHGPRDTNKIRVNLSALPLKKGDTQMSPITTKKDDIQVSPLADKNKGDKGDISAHKGDISGHKGDIQVSPEPLLEPPLLEPSLTTTSPWELFEAMCDECGVDPSEITGTFRDRQLHAAKSLVKSGASPDDIRREVRWLSGQSWLTSGIDMQLLAGQWPKWILAKRPDKPLTKQGSVLDGTKPAFVNGFQNYTAEEGREIRRRAFGESSIP